MPASGVSDFLVYLHIMNLLQAFYRLIRFPNLVFIACTQLAFYFGIILPCWNAHPGSEYSLHYPLFGLLVLASVCIAAGGYIINDYFDLNIDRVNKPDNLVIDRVIRRRWAIVWHILFSLLGLALSYYIGYRLGNPLVGILNTIAVLLLWFYSTSFKKQLLVGNVVISLLTAWVVLILYVCESKLSLIELSDAQSAYLSDVFKLAVLYGAFAFITSLIREVVKDMEDMHGDGKYHCRTMPLVWGIEVSKIFVYIWMLVLTAAVLIFSVYALQIKWWGLSVYLILLVLVPLVMLFPRLRKSLTTKDFALDSRFIKWIMLTGILSMLIFKWYL
jgi:4-hydroxybenzoate polyprenyltransferase